MESVLEELRKKYSEKITVEFIDVILNTQIGEKYKIEMIPTQIFLDFDGKEFFGTQDFSRRMKLSQNGRPSAMNWVNSNWEK